MATYNSTQDGNWNTDATWAEAGHPNANDDITIITHDVTYDVGVSAITWGNCTINSGGILIFPIAASSKMLFNATGILTINNGGELRAGTDGAPIGVSYLCQIHWPQGSSGRNVLVLNNGGKIDIYGDPAYYGSAKTAILDSQWAAGSGLTLYVEGDYSAKWAAGQHFVIYDFAQYVSYTTDSETFEIDSVGAYDAGNDRTPIVVTAAGDSDTFLVGAKLWMLDRNVELLDPGSSWDIYGYNSYTERLSFDNNQGVGGTLIHFEEVLFRGWNYCSFYGYGFECYATVFLNNMYLTYASHQLRLLEDCLFVSNYYSLYNSQRIQIEGDFVGHYMGIYSNCENGSSITNFYNCFYGISSPEDFSLVGDIIGCNKGIVGGKFIKFVGNIDKCVIGLEGAENSTIIGNITNCSQYGITSALSISLIGSITDCGVAINGPTGINKLKNGVLSGNSNDTSGIVSSSAIGGVEFENYTIGAVTKELQIELSAGKILCLHSGEGNWQVPPSGESFILEFEPNINCDVIRTGWLSLPADPLNMMSTYITSGAKTLTFKIYPVGWAASIDQDDIVLEVLYLDGAGVSRARAVNSSETYANAGWRDMTVSFTAGQDGIVYFMVHLKKYEAGCYVLLDPEWSVS